MYDTVVLFTDCLRSLWENQKLTHTMITVSNNESDLENIRIPAENYKRKM